ncbi:MAG: BON domain-containing protein [Nitrospirota bacterium]
MKKIILVSVVLILALALFAGCAKMKGQTAGEYLDDSTITARVNAAILKDADAQYFKTDVTTTNGDVVLQGFVNSRETEQRLISKIKQIEGVKSVRSLLKVDPSMTGSTAGEYIDDVGITAKANAVIVRDSDANYLKIDVTTTRGDVVLQGFVNSRETEQRLIAKIKQIEGVKSVKSLLKIQDR